MNPTALLKTVALGALAAAVVTAAGCGGRQAMKPSTTVPPECEFLPPPADIPDTISVALFDVPDPVNAPLARTVGEALLFHHLYETLTTVDCLGEIRGALAASWERGGGGRRWTFRLREDARFWNGKPVTAWDVEWWWQTAMRRHATLEGAVDSMSVTGERTLSVFFRRGRRDVPRLLSSPEFAVAAPAYDSSWPLGSGPFRVASAARDSPRRGIRIVPAFGGTVPVIEFIRASPRDARDLIDRGVDALVTADPDVIDYASGRDRLAAAALPWDRTYVVLSPSRVRLLGSGGEVASISLELREDLARDAVRRDARGCGDTFWWRELEDCERLDVAFASVDDAPGGDYAFGPRRILFDADDPVARDLAQRVVALASEDPAASAQAAEIAAAFPPAAGSRSRIVADGVFGGELSASLRAGDDFAYIFSLPARVADPCYERRKLLRRAPWLLTAGAELPNALVPLVDTRSHLIADAERVGAAVDWYGNILLYGWMPEGDVLP